MAKMNSRTFKITDEYIQGREFVFKSKQQKIGVESQNVRLRIDAAGLILYWDYLKLREGKFVFVDAIVDARVPKNDKKTLVICCNKNFVSAQFFEFEATDGNEVEVVAQWATYIFQWVMFIDELAHESNFQAYWNKRQYHSVMRHMHRLFAQLFLDDSTKHKRKNAYEHLNRPYDHQFRKFLLGSSVRSITSVDELLDVYLDKVQRPEVMQIFNQLKSSNQTTLSPKQFADFINNEQRDRRLNEVEIYPKKSYSAAERLIRELENGESRLSIRGFMRYLLSETDLDSNMFQLKPTTMNETITHYYCSSSHNRHFYLIGSFDIEKITRDVLGNQIHAANHLLKDKFHDICLTEVEIYRQILLAGCRCIELDCWDGPTGPVITHGPISLQQINTVPFEDVCEAIMDSGFKSSDYPIVLSLENHCSPPQQQQMACYFKEIFGEHLQDTPLPNYPLEPGVLLPSPNLLRPNSKKKPPKLHPISNMFQSLKVDVERRMRVRSISPKPDEEGTSKRQSQITISDEINNIPKDFMKDEAVDTVETQPVLAQQINYFQTSPVLSYGLLQHQYLKHALCLDDPYFLMHSGSESKLDKIITKRSREFIQHTANHIIRVYPEILRCNSSNFIPMYFWSAGAQMCALNMQTPGIEMQMNQTLFEENGQCGYVLKSRVLCDRMHKMSVHDKHICVANRLEISIKSVQLLNLLVPMRGDTITTYVRCDLYDLPNDTIIGKYRTTQSTSDGYNTLYLDNKSSNRNTLLMNENDEEIAQRFLAVHKIQAGPASVFEELRDRYVDPLREKNQRENERKNFENPFNMSGKSQKKQSTE
ncbi:hypothetical protein M3Y96_00373000 [Aphelenchoides besseyi]|nr:hypothetical protein M3Y96_00373000 [Aphelenchoides besseyi]